MRIKRRIVSYIAIVLIILIPVSVFADFSTPSLRHPYDYYAHFAVNAAVVSTLGVLSKENGNPMWMNITFPIIYATILSVGKELADGRFGWDDLAADVAGMAFGSIIVIRW